jgi:HAD superfamily hydrolase (TIGR01509 family)
VFLSPRELDRLQEKIEKERSELFQQKYLPQVRPFPKVRELFQRILDDGKRIALASSGKKDEVEKYERIAGIDDLIKEDDKTSSDDAERSKPDPDIFHAALAKLGRIPKDEVIAVGDTPYDAEAAGKAGLRTIGVLCGGFPEADLRAAGCIAIYRDPADLLANYEASPIARG